MAKHTGEVSRTFTLSGNCCFYWEPLSGYSFVFTINQFKKLHDRYRFCTWLQTRINPLGLGYAWASYSFYVSSAAPGFHTECSNMPPVN